MTKFRKAYGPIVRSKIDTGPGLTKQNHKQECNVNFILAKYQKTGIIAHRNEFETRYDDATSMDFQEAMNKVIATQQMFNELPSTIRKKFNHRPEQFLEFVNDPKNQDEMIELGLATDNRPPPETPIKVEVINTPETSSEAS